MTAQHTTTTTTGADDEEPHFWIMQPDLVCGVRCAGIFRCKLPLVGLFVKTIVAGAAMDRLTSEVNQRLVNSIARSRTLREMPSFLPKKHVDALFAATITSDAARAGMDLFMPLRLMYYSDALHGDIEMFGVQERVFYQMLHLWDEIRPAERVALAKSAMSPDEFEECVIDSVAEMAEMPSRDLLRLVMLRRGMHLAERETDCAHEPRRQVGVTGGVARGTTCKCGRQFYQAALAAEYYDVSVVDPGLAHVMGHLGDSTCGTTQYTVVLAAYAVWTGLRMHAVKPSTAAVAAAIDVNFVIRQGDHPMLRSELGAQMVRGAVVLPCNHNELRAHLYAMHQLAEPVPAAGGRAPSSFVADFEAGELRACWHGDATLMHWFDALRSAMGLAWRVPEGARRLLELIRDWSPEPGRLPLRDAVRWMCFDFMYLRNVSINVVLDETEHPVPEAYDAQWLTFGLVPERDDEWREAQDRIAEFIEAVGAVTAFMKGVIRQQLIAESDAEDARRARKRGGGRRRGAKSPDKPATVAVTVLVDRDLPNEAIMTGPASAGKSHIADVIEKALTPPSPKSKSEDAPPVLESVDEVPALEPVETRAAPDVMPRGPETIGLVSWSTFGTSKMSFEYVPHYVEVSI